MGNIFSLPLAINLTPPKRWFNGGCTTSCALYQLRSHVTLQQTGFTRFIQCLTCIMLIQVCPFTNHVLEYVSRRFLNNGQRTGNSALLVVTSRSANPTDKVALLFSFPAIGHTSTDNSYFYMPIPEFYFP